MESLSLFFEELCNGLSDPVCVIDPNDSFRFVYANPAACAFFDYSCGELLEMTLPGLDVEIPARRYERFMEHLRQKQTLHHETVFLRRAGQSKRVPVNFVELVVRGRSYLSMHIRGGEQPKAAG